MAIGGGALRATGEPVNVELTIDKAGKIKGQAKQLSIGDDGLSLEGDVQFTVADKTLKADRVKFDEDETTVMMLLQGSVHVISNDEKKPTEIHCEELNIDLCTGDIQLGD